MTSITYEAENAVFHFDKANTIEYLNQYLSNHNINEAVEILDFILNSTDDPVSIPDGYDWFGFIVLDLISNGKGSVKCMICNKTFQPHQLKSFSIGHGNSPLNINFKQKGGIKGLFGKRQKLPGMSGGKGFKCLEGHELIAMRTWIT